MSRVSVGAFSDATSVVLQSGVSWFLMRLICRPAIMAMFSDGLPHSIILECTVVPCRAYSPRKAYWAFWLENTMIVELLRLVSLVSQHFSDDCTQDGLDLGRLQLA